MTAPALTGILGWPVSHSRSPEIHARWLAENGIAAEYVHLATPPEKLEEEVRSLASRGFRGVNVTVPHKETVMKLLDAISETARAIGAVNTIIVEPSGKLRGENTDAYGFIAPLKTIKGWQEMVRHPLILGAGGAARAVVSALKEAGAERIRITNRTQEKAKKLAQEFDLEILPWEARETALAETSLLVNTTTLGMQGKEPLALSLAALPVASAVYDIVYAPRETELLRAAKLKGCTVIEGLPMLYHQAAKSFEHWWGVLPKVEMPA
jgi:shikimate dehydrogenase